MNNGICDELIKNDENCAFDGNDCRAKDFFDRKCQQVAESVINCENNELVRRNFPYCSDFIPECGTEVPTTTTTTTTTTSQDSVEISNGDGTEPPFNESSSTLAELPFRGTMMLTFLKNILDV